MHCFTHRFIPSEAAGRVDGYRAITPELAACKGRTGGPYELPEEVSRADVRRFLAAIGDDNPLYRDAEFARAHGYRGQLVPPAMVLELCLRPEWNLADPNPVFWHNLPLPPGFSVTRNAGAETEWLEPLCVGDRLTLRWQFTDVTEREGRRGLAIYTTRLCMGENQHGAPVIHTRQTVVHLRGG